MAENSRQTLENDRLKAHSQRASAQRAADRRLFGLVIGVVYLTVLSFSLSAITGLHLGISFVLVAVAAMLQMAILSYLAARFVRPNRQDRQIGLTSALLIFVALAIYLAAFRLVITSASNAGVVFAARELIFVCIYGTAFIGLTTLVLLNFADGLMWLAVAIVRWRGRKRQ